VSALDANDIPLHIDRLMTWAEGHYYGVYPATVTDNQDPSSQGRVEVLLPWSPDASGAKYSVWARLATMMAGGNRGTWFIPEVGDEVLVAFEGGDLRQAVVIGGLFGSKNTMPTTEIDNGSVAVRGITSRLGHTILLLDGTETAKEAIELTLAGGQHVVHVGKDQLNVQVPSGLPINIVAGNSSIKFANDGSIAIAAPKISIQAQSELTVQGAKVGVTASGQMQLQSNGQMQVQGAIVQVQSDGPAAIKGSPVAIN
jgi:uncharacterized protein involved in type VI secretion and phage assembly